MGVLPQLKKKILPVTYIEKYVDFFLYSAASGRYLSEEKTYSKLFTWLDYWKWYFYSNKAWIALHVGMAHFVWVTLVGFLVLENAFMFWTLGMADLEAVQDVWWDNLHFFYLERFSSSAVSQQCWCFSLCNLLKSWGTPVCVWSSYLKCSTIKIMNVAMLREHMLSTRLTATFKLYAQNGTWKKCCSEKQSILEST